MELTLKTLFIADIVGESGLGIVETLLPGLVDKYKSDIVIANAENAHEGRGLNREMAERLFTAGVSVITGGNHSFDKWKIFSYMKSEKRLLRPFNFPDGAPGFGYGVYSLEKCGVEFGVLNLQGRTFMNAIEDPFYAAASMVDQIRERTPLILVDFHAEATAEKMALGWELDGKVSLVIGTHTHIPTNDARILPKGTGYITDAGMSGPFDSVIGMQKKGAIRRFKSGLPQKFHVAKGDLRICGLSSEIDKKSGRCIHIEPVIYPPFEHYGGEMG